MRTDSILGTYDEKFRTFYFRTLIVRSYNGDEDREKKKIKKKTKEETIWTHEYVE